MVIQTKRLRLRNWKESDFDPFCDMCADQDVMRYFPSTLKRDESVAVAHKIKSLIDQKGWGFWAVEIPGACEFIGFVGLHVPTRNLPFLPRVEVGWWLNKPYWGKGYASEAAKAALDYGFSVLQLKEIVAFTAAINLPSIRVMEGVGMRNTGNDFEHPDVPVGSSLRRHVLYRISHSDI